jgi:hypothetical protein
MGEMKTRMQKKLAFASYNPKVLVYFRENGEIRPMHLLYTTAN